jgi:hypothetical protein
VLVIAALAVACRVPDPVTDGMDLGVGIE